MEPFKSLRKFLLIEDPEDEVVEEVQTEMQEVKPVVQPEPKVEVKEEVKPEEKEILPEKTKKLSEIVPSAESTEVRKPKRRVHINVSEPKKEKQEKPVANKSRKYESTPIISPIYGMTQKNNSRVILATKPETVEIKHKTTKKDQDSVLDTIISPIFGTDLGGENNHVRNDSKTVVYNEILDDEFPGKNSFEGEKLSLDDILQTPAKNVIKKSELSQNMTIFDDDIEEN